MPSSNFDDTRGRREANRQLRVGDVWVADVRWCPQLQQAMQTLSTRGLAKPAGLDPDGKFWLRPNFLADTMLVRYVLWYQEMPRGPGSGGVKIGWFIMDYLPDRQRHHEKPVRTHGREVQLCVKKGGNPDTRTVRVLVDGDGLPVPVPPEIWQAMGLDATP